MKVLLLGATGNLGLRLIPALLVHNHTLTIYVRSPSKLRSLVPDSLLSQCTIVVGDAADSAAVKRAIIENNCDAVVDTAGNQVVPWSKPEDFQLPKLAASISTAAREAGKERGRPHQGTADVLDVIPTDELAWSLLCVGNMRARSKAIEPIVERRPHGLLVQKDANPGYVFHWISYIPIVGALLNFIWEMVNYVTKLEDVADLIAEDLASGSADITTKRDWTLYEYYLKSNVDCRGKVKPVWGGYEFYKVDQIEVASAMRAIEKEETAVARKKQQEKVQNAVDNDEDFDDFIDEFVPSPARVAYTASRKEHLVKRNQDNLSIIQWFKDQDQKAKDQAARLRDGRREELERRFREQGWKDKDFAVPEWTSHPLVKVARQLTEQGALAFPYVAMFPVTDF
ncbi:hypothetical protein MNV49_004618 [Pseudohyphozyma bogoriensis]|nr:hypothetical protein MNV49_004618 [Pseudohyphozyma bogoriensis]